MASNLVQLVCPFCGHQAGFNFEFFNERTGEGKLTCQVCLKAFGLAMRIIKDRDEDIDDGC